MGWGDCTLGCFLRDQVKIVSRCDFLIYNTSWLWIVEVAGVELNTDSLVGDHIDQVNLGSTFFDGLLELSDLNRLHDFLLSITGSIPKHNHVHWFYLVAQLELVDCFGCESLETGAELT